MAVGPDLKRAGCKLARRRYRLADGIASALWNLPAASRRPTRAAIGHATALAVARRARVPEGALRRNRSSLHTQDDLMYPHTAPVDL